MMAGQRVKLATIRGHRGTLSVRRVQHVCVWRGRIEVERTYYSDRDWVEVIYATPDAYGVVLVLDLSTAGEDNSYLLLIEDGHIVKKVPWAKTSEEP